MSFHPRNKLSEALVELKSEILNGKSLDEVVDGIAKDFELNPALLRRKFVESYRSEEALRATVRETSVEKLVQQNTEKTAQRYGVPADATKVVRYKGDKYNVICRDGNTLKMVRQSDGWTCQINANRAHGMELV